MLKALLKTMRPKQWTKNAFIFAALVFDRKLTSIPHLVSTVIAFILFCLVSSIVYIVNDLVDIEKDRQHPTKRYRPLPAGELSPRVAAITALILTFVSIPIGFRLDRQFGIILSAYLLTMFAYSFYLKRFVIIDVMTIAAGFVLRVAAGVVLVNVTRFSPWLYVCTTLLALFLGFSKRRHELFTLGINANAHRASLEHYTLELLDQMIGVVTSTTVVAYAFYTFSAEGLPPNHLMMLTIPFVLYGIFRYQYLVHVLREGGTPEELLLKDKPLLGTILMWGISVVLVLYVLPAS